MISAGQTNQVKVTDIGVGRQILCKEKPNARVTSVCAKKLTATVKAAKQGFTLAQQKMWQQMVFTSAVLNVSRFSNLDIMRRFRFCACYCPQPTRAESYKINVREILNGKMKFKDIFGKRHKWSDYLIKGAKIIKKLLVMKDIPSFNEAIKNNPKNASLYYGRGILLAKLGKHFAAERDFSQALKFGCKEADIYLYRGKVLLALKKHSRAIEDFDDFILKKPKNADAYYYRAIAKNNSRQSLEALSDFNKAISLGKKNGGVHYERGKLLASFGEYKRAVGDFNRAIKVDRKNRAKYYLARGKAKAAMRQFQSARNDFDKAQKLNPALNTKSQKLKLSLIPELIFNGQFRYGFSNGGIMDGRTAITAMWYMANLYKNLNFGTWLEFGYSGSPKHNAVDFGGGLVLINQFSSSNLVVEAGAGYAAIVSGDSEKAATRKGGFFKYGLRYGYRVSNVLSAGASLSLQHEIKDPKRFAIVPGVDLTFNLW